MPACIKYKGVNTDELQQVAELHHNYLNSGFLSQLGTGFLFHLYNAIHDDPSSILIIAIDSGKVVGFISGGSGLKSIYKRLIKKSFFRVAFSLAPHLLNPLKLKKIIEILLYSKKDSHTNDYPKAELLSLVVKKEYRRSGIAQELFGQLVEQFKEREFSAFKIIVGSELIGAQKFYEKIGAKKIDSVELHQGQSSIVYSMEIS